MIKNLRVKVLLLYPPRYYWPFINEYDNILLPQALVCLGAVLEKEGIDVKIIDCLAEKIGWRSLAEKIKEENPDVVGVSESHALYSHEALKCLKMVKEIDPKVITIGGGIHFTTLHSEIMRENPFIDFIVRGEGERTIIELLKEIESPHKNFSKVKGITYREGKEIIVNPPQRLIENLDTIPLPAYYLVPMDAYGRARYLFSPGGITIHHSRGCISKCAFCIWWRQMAERIFIDGKEVLIPKWRTKSVERVMEEIEILYKKYNKRCLIFVDESWNINPKWDNEFAELLIRSGMKINWFAFMRVDKILEEEELGIFEKLVKSGLSNISVGVERFEDDDLKTFEKGFYTREKTLECFKILKKKYPGLFLQGTFIVGTRNETRESMLRVVEFAKELGLDYPAFHPLTPVPGTEIWEEYKEKGWIEDFDFKHYDWTTPVMSSEFLNRQEIEDLLVEMNWRYVTPMWFLKGIFSRSKYKRRMYIWWLLVAMKVLWGTLKSRAYPWKWEEISGLKKPKWYDL